MIEKVVKISNLGRFMSCQPSGNTAFKSTTLVYADNGRGKTTFAAMLRSLGHGDHLPITERRAIADPGDPYVKLIVDGAPIKYESSSWQGTRPRVEVFDQTFVEQNVYSGSVVDASHRKNLHGLAIGEKGVALAQDVDDLGTKIGALNVPIARAETAVATHGGGLLSVAAFCGLSEVPDVDKQIQLTAGKLKAASEKVLIGATEKLTSVSLPTVRIDDVLAQLKTTLEGVSASAVATTRDHISNALDESGETWLRRGFGYLEKSSGCPFCGQDVKDNELVAAYRQ